MTCNHPSAWGRASAGWSPAGSGRPAGTAGAVLLAGLVLAVGLCGASPALGQQRPLVTEDPEVIGAGRILVEAGVDWQRGRTFPASGLTGNLVRLPVVGISFGISSIAELQVDGGFYNRLSVTERREAPLSDLVDFTGDTTRDVEDLVVATKVRLLSERGGRPGVALRFATRLPNAGNESGLGLDTTDFLFTVIVGKTVESVRVVANGGLGILGNPVQGNAQNDVFLYGLSVARAVTSRAEVVAEINGWIDTAEGHAPPGTESRGMLRIGTRYTLGAGRVDAAVLIGMTSRDAGVGLAAGYTHVFDAFRLP
jgi:hypothetical protein